MAIERSLPEILRSHAWEDRQHRMLRERAADRIEALEAEVTRYQQLLDATIDDYNGARNAALEAAAKVAESVKAPKSIGRDKGRHHEAGAQHAAAAIRALKSDAPPAPELRTRKAEER